MAKANAGGTHSEGASGITESGLYHVVCESCVESEDKATMDVVVVSPGSQVGRKKKLFINFFAKTDDKQKTVTRRMLMFARAFGLTEQSTREPFTQALWERADKENLDLEFDFTEAEGRQAVFEMVVKPYSGTDEKYQGKSFAEVEWGIYHVLDPQASAAKFDAETMAAFGLAVPTPAVQKAATPASQQPPKPAPAAHPPQRAAAPTPAAQAAPAAAEDPWANFA